MSDVLELFGHPIHAYRFGERKGKYIIELALRLSTDAEGVAACLGLKAEPKVEFDRIVRPSPGARDG